IGDIHGAHKALEQVLERASTTRDDQLIFLGDYVDGWSESPQVIDKLIELKNTHTCVFIRGNHDALLAEWMATQEENEMWLKHGGQSTVAAYQKLPQAKINKHLEFLKSLK